MTGFKHVLKFGSAQLYLALDKEIAEHIVASLQAALDEMRTTAPLKPSAAAISDLHPKRLLRPHCVR
jgi:hypothetical protein